MDGSHLLPEVEHVVIMEELRNGKQKKSIKKTYKKCYKEALEISWVE
jgi:hypothetical protein